MLNAFIRVKLIRFFKNQSELANFTLGQHNHKLSLHQDHYAGVHVGLDLHHHLGVDVRVADHFAELLKINLSFIILKIF